MADRAPGAAQGRPAAGRETEQPARAVFCERVYI